MRISFAGLWRSPDFLRLWAGQGISLLGSQIGGGALRYTAILVLGASPLQISLLSAAGLLPALLLALPAGIWVDRVHRRPVLVAADVGRALLLLSIPLAFALGLLRIEQLYLVALLVGALTILFDTAYPSFLPSVVRREHLVEANSKLAASDSLAEIAGPPLGGALVQLVTAPLAILLDALSFLASALLLRRVRADESAGREPASEQGRREPAVAGVRQELAEGLAAVRGRPALTMLLGIAVTQGMAGGIIGSLYDLYLIRELGIGPALIGLIVGVGGVSALAGAALAERVARRYGIRATLLWALLIGAGAETLIPLASGAWALPFLIASQLADVAGAVFAINAITLRQSVTPDRLLGRVNSGFNLLGTGAALLGALGGGALAQLVGLRGAVAAGVAISALAAAWVLAARDIEAE